MSDEMETNYPPPLVGALELPLLNDGDAFLECFNLYHLDARARAETIQSKGLGACSPTVGTCRRHSVAPKFAQPWGCGRVILLAKTTTK